MTLNRKVQSAKSIAESQILRKPKQKLYALCSMLNVLFSAE
jgi:hypothetical protein